MYLAVNNNAFWRTNANVVWRRRTCVMNYVDQQTLNPDDDYVLPYQRLWMFDVLVCPLSATEPFLSQTLVCGTVFHRTSLLPPLSPSSALVLTHISLIRIPLSDSSLICTGPAQWLVILDTMIYYALNIYLYRPFHGIISGPTLSPRLTQNFTVRPLSLDRWRSAEIHLSSE